MLAELLDRHAGNDAEARRLKQVFAGIIGAANSTAQKEGATGRPALRARFRSRFAQTRELPPGLIQDPDFELWIEKRAAELGS